MEKINFKKLAIKAGKVVVYAAPAVGSEVAAFVINKGATTQQVVPVSEVGAYKKGLHNYKVEATSNGVSTASTVTKVSRREAKGLKQSTAMELEQRAVLGAVKRNGDIAAGANNLKTAIRLGGYGASFALSTLDPVGKTTLYKKWVSDSVDEEAAPEVQPTKAGKTGKKKEAPAAAPAVEQTFENK